MLDLSESLKIQPTHPFKPCSISQEMFGGVTNVGYCFSQMESDPVCARLL